MHGFFSEDVKGWYGFMGLGGSVFHWHPGHRISFVFLPTYLDWTDFSMARGVRLRDVVFECVLNMKKTQVEVADDTSRV